MWSPSNNIIFDTQSHRTTETISRCVVIDHYKCSFYCSSDNIRFFTVTAMWLVTLDVIIHSILRCTSLTRYTRLLLYLTRKFRIVPTYIYRFPCIQGKFGWKYSLRSNFSLESSDGTNKQGSILKYLQKVLISICSLENYKQIRLQIY